MVAKKRSRHEGDLLEKYGNFSKRLTEHHHLENLSEFVLHDMCNTELFGLPKAAYLVNNPDFLCLKGVAGYHHPESFKAGDTWLNQKEFTAHMKGSEFNQMVRSLHKKALAFNTYDHKDQIYQMADDLNIHDPLFHVWNLKHKNQGILIFEQGYDEQTHQNHLEKFLYMLSFCPIF